MGGLILCTAGLAKNPYYVKDLGIHLYSAEELCYYIYHNVMLLEDDFISEDLLQFIHQELGLNKLAEKLRAYSMQDTGTRLLTILQEIPYLDADEMGMFQKKLEEKKRSKPHELLKNKADYMTKQKKFAGAITVYESLLNAKNVEEFSEEFIGRLWHNKAVAECGLFSFAQAGKSMLKAYEYLKKDSIVKELYQIYLLGGEEAILESTFAAISAEQQYRWKEEFEEVRRQAGFTGKPKMVSLVSQKDRIRREEGMAALLTEWKQEYREMTV